MLLPLQLNNLLASGAPTATVPDVVGAVQAQAVIDIGAAGFVASVVFDYSGTVAAGVVISQVPTGGSTALVGSTVAITVSLGVRTNSGAGRPRRPRRKRYVLRIDGKIFEADSEAEALALIEGAQRLAEQAANNRADEIVKKALPKAVSLGRVKPIAIKAPSIMVPDELQAAADMARAAIERTYADASAAAELRLLLALQAMQEEEEDLLLLLH
jgi:hypothetical protein